MCVAPSLLGVLPSRHEECVHMRFARADRLLLDAADRPDRAVREDLARGGDLVAAHDVLAQLLEDVESEREPC